MKKASIVAFSLFASTVSAFAQTPEAPSPGWGDAMPPGPDTRVKNTEAYTALVARDAYVWAWPLVNIYNRRLAFKDVPEMAMSGPVPVAPLNRLAMLTDYHTGRAPCRLS